MITKGRMVVLQWFSTRANFYERGETSGTYISKGVSEGCSKRRPLERKPKTSLPPMPGYGTIPVKKKRC